MAACPQGIGTQEQKPRLDRRIVPRRTGRCVERDKRRRRLTEPKRAQRTLLL
jgi:hypothetical protein